MSIKRAYEATTGNILSPANKGQAKIDNWRAFPNKRAPLYLIGTVSYHTRQRQFQSSTQETSHIIKYDFANNWVETQNTIYTLGKEAVK